MSGTQMTVRELMEYRDHIDNLNGELASYAHTSDMPPWDELCWHMPWEQFKADGGRFLKSNHGFCGVYRLVGLDSKGIPATIDRLGGKDTTGTLYVGEAGSLHQRLNQLRRSLLGNEDSHGAIGMWCDSQVLRSTFPKERLSIAIFWSTSAAIRKIIERDLIRVYLKSFGDTPPLNCSY